MSIGGNDVFVCDTAAQLLSCAKSVLKVVKRNLTGFLAALRKSAGPGVPIVGLTYPDIFLGSYLSPARNQKRLAMLSVTEFRDLLNPTLSAAYSSVGGDFVDVTKATGGVHAVQPDDELWSLRGNSRWPSPKSVSLRTTANSKTFTRTTLGYTIIARSIVATLPNQR